MKKLFHRPSHLHPVLKDPTALVVMFVLLEDLLSNLLTYSASTFTGFLRSVYHFHKLPLLVREIRSEFIEVLVALFCVQVMSQLPRSISLDKIGLAARGAFGYFTAGLVTQVGSAVVIAVLLDRQRQLLAALHLHSTVAASQLFLCFLVGVAEEVVFRGYVLQVLERRWGSMIALLLSSIFFGLEHLQNPGETAVDVVNVIVDAGVPLAAAYLMSRSLWLSIGLHCGWNFYIYVFFGVPSGFRVVPEMHFTQTLCELEALLQLVLAILFVVLAVRKGRWVSCKAAVSARIELPALTSSAE